MTETQSLIRKASQPRLQQAEYGRLTWLYSCEAGTQLADILQPQFWAGLNPAPQSWDHIEVREELGAWWAELIVRSSTSEGILVAGIKAVELESVAPRNFQPFDAEGLVVVYKGPHLKWCVENRDARQLQGGFPDEQQAAHWLRDHIRVKNKT